MNPSPDDPSPDEPNGSVRRVTFNGASVLTSYPPRKVQRALRIALLHDVCEASKRCRLPVSIICLWCRMVEIEYSLPEYRARLNETDYNQIRHFLSMGHDPKDVALWYGYTEDELNQRIKRRTQ